METHLIFSKCLVPTTKQKRGSFTLRDSLNCGCTLPVCGDTSSCSPGVCGQLHPHSRPLLRFLGGAEPQTPGAASSPQLLLPGAAPRAVPAAPRAWGHRYSPGSSSRQRMQRSCPHSMAGGFPKPFPAPGQLRGRSVPQQL